MKKNLKKKKRISPFFLGSEKEYFAENLSMLLSAGIGVSMALTIISEGSSGRNYRQTLVFIANDVDDGSPLWKALVGKGIFNDSYIYMTKVGEASGRLSENLAIIAEQSKKNKSFNSKLASALIYPSIILSLAVIIGIGVTAFVIPNMAKIFSGMKMKLPLPTQIMINLGNFVTNDTIFFILLIVIFLATVIVIFFVPRTKKIGQVILYKTPIIGVLYKEIEIARFGYIMYSLTEAGIPLTEALSSIEQSTNLTPYKKFYHYLFQNVDEGVSLEKSFLKYKNINQLMPINIQQMIVAGEHSGNFVNILGKISAIYEEKIDMTSKNLTTILEPILLIIVALGVLFLALAIITPIYSLVGGLNA